MIILNMFAVFTSFSEYGQISYFFKPFYCGLTAA